MQLMSHTIQDLKRRAYKNFKWQKKNFQVPYCPYKPLDVNIYKTMSFNSCNDNSSLLKSSIRNTRFPSHILSIGSFHVITAILCHEYQTFNFSHWQKIFLKPFNSNRRFSIHNANISSHICVLTIVDLKVLH